MVLCQSSGGHTRCLLVLIAVNVISSGSEHPICIPDRTLSSYWYRRWNLTSRRKLSRVGEALGSRIMPEVLKSVLVLY